MKQVTITNQSIRVGSSEDDSIGLNYLVGNYGHVRSLESGFGHIIYTSTIVPAQTVMDLGVSHLVEATIPILD